MTPAENDHFSKQSAEYAEYRPRYPKELFAYLASLTPEHELAVDCATGNGQAAIGLAEHFRSVVAFDQSAEQLAHVQPHPRISYHIAKAEKLAVASHSADIVTVAQALHWFSLGEFYAEVRRVLKPKGILAVWAYNLHRITPDVDAIVSDYHDRVLDGYWPPERSHIINGYRSLPFSFRELTPPPIVMHTHWTLDHLIGYLRSWSATQRFIDQNRRNPLDIIGDRLRAAWGESQSRQVSWPLTLRIGIPDFSL